MTRIDIQLRARSSQLWARGALALAVGLLSVVCFGTPARAESTYGYASSGSGTLTATGRVNLSVTVPKLILLRVGAANATQSSLTWAPTFSIQNGPTSPNNGNNTAINWNAAAPTLAVGSQPSALTVAAWTNAGVGTLSCAVGAWSAAGGPPNSSFAVSGSGTLAHPGGDLGACSSSTIASNVLASGSWTYTLNGTPTSWTAGAYSATVTYTASGV
ncbi:hypothetical protein [Pseudacidovorax intermedius]|uniref:Uncharacterized protein n=1 Tax=Pseudacidovorax intermedius TaxID=433924 RepID=A0A370FAB5_9BURK|nr:hypothetical protein [Pseudacidovorax intermedius]RDI21260.1 hypothetical protein DFR41_10956 [Pseudacidovorax intermedius]